MARKRLILAAGLALLATVASVAQAIQPGTTGTDKRNQQMAVRSAVITQKNNTATASGGAATLNAAGSGIITSESLTTVAGSPYTLTLTNNMIAAADLVFATAQLGSATTGEPMVGAVTPGAGSVVIVVKNVSTFAAFNGTIKVGFIVIKQSAIGAD